jgi:hypothetical protein
MNKKNSDIVLSMIALRLFHAMGNSFGTDEKTVVIMLSKCYTKADLKTVIRKFGVIQNKNLNDWLYYELGGKSLQIVKEIYKRLHVRFKKTFNFIKFLIAILNILYNHAYLKRI